MTEGVTQVRQASLTVWGFQFFIKIYIN